MDTSGVAWHLGLPWQAALRRRVAQRMCYGQSLRRFTWHAPAWQPAVRDPWRVYTIQYIRLM